jgi:hypothetical protein
VSGHEINQCRLLPVVLAIRDFLALFEYVFFGLLVGNTGRRRGLPAILGVMVRVLVATGSPRRYRAGAAGRGKQSRRMRDDDVVMEEVGRP